MCNRLSRSLVLSTFNMKKDVRRKWWHPVGKSWAELVRIWTPPMLVRCSITGFHVEERLVSQASWGRVLVHSGYIFDTLRMIGLWMSQFGFHWDCSLQRVSRRPCQYSLCSGLLMMMVHTQRSSLYQLREQCRSRTQMNGVGNVPARRLHLTE